MRPIQNITNAINWYEQLKPGLFSKICLAFPLLLKIVRRLPRPLRLKILEPMAAINERIVEIPWVFMNLGITQGKILDVGCCWSSVSMELASFGFEVWGIDLDPCALTHPNFKFIQGDVCRSSLPERFFDRVVDISTLEHIGLGHFQDTIQPDGDRQAVQSIHRVLKTGGRFLMTVPFGQRCVTAWFRVYDSSSLAELIGPFKLVRQEFYIQRGGHWVPATQAEAAMMALTDRGRLAAVALVEAVKQADRL